MDNNEKGLKYELYICNFLNDEGHAWMWNRIPEEHLLNSGLVHDLNKHRLKRKKHVENPDEYTNPIRDTGIDLLLLVNDKYVLIQCKNGYKKGLTFSDLNGFSIMMLNHEDKEGRVYYTSKLSTNITENAISKRIFYIKKKMPEDDDIIIVKPKNKKFKLRDYQKIACDKLTKHFKKNNRGILSMPCGTGKTIMGCFFAHAYDSVILLSPLKQYAEQNADRYNEYFNDFCHLIIDSDGTRDIDEIKKFIEDNKNKKLLFSCTFKSVDIVNKFIDDLDNNIVIIDEFHNLSRNNIVDENDDINKLLMSDSKILFQSATPRVYDLENTDDDDEHEDIFGEIVHKMDFGTAIKDGYICDYNIYLPSVSEKKKKFIEKIQKEVDISVYDDNLKAKCMYFYKCMLHNGTQKCIVYLRDINEMNEFKKCLKTFDEYYATNLLIYTISSNDKHSSLEKPEKNSREWKLNMFQKTDRMTAILSVHILDECVDIPKCDSIFITYTTQAKRRTIQRICRCIRKDVDNKHKIGCVYMWCDEYEEILETLGGLKEHDCLFKDKIKLIGSCYDAGQNKNDDMVKKDIDVVDNYLISIKEYKRKTWDEWLKIAIEYINTHNKKPTKSTNKQLSKWISSQMSHYNTKRHLMVNKSTYEKWTKFINNNEEYFCDNKTIWINNLNFVKKYIDEHKKKPSCAQNNNNRKYGIWIRTQQSRYKNKQRIMKSTDIYDMWTEFINNYSEYFIDKETEWFNSLGKIKNYIDKNKKLPSTIDENINVCQLGTWIHTQQITRAKNQHIMKNNKIMQEWDNFVSKYKQYFLSKEERWIKNLEKIKSYIDTNKKIPSTYDKNNETRKIGRWFTAQQSYNYKKTHNIKCDTKIFHMFKKWNEFIDEYKIERRRKANK